MFRPWEILYPKPTKLPSNQPEGQFPSERAEISSEQAARPEKKIIEIKLTGVVLILTVGKLISRL